MKAVLRLLFGLGLLLVLLIPQRGFALERAPAKVIDSNFSPPAASLPDDAYWDGRFTMRGLSGQVNAVAVSGSNVYVGGSFVTADNIVVNRIAKWNGSSWSALSDGVGCGVSYCAPSVNAIATSGNNAYVGGLFTTAGSVAASSIAVWDGSSWSALGTGVEGTVYAIAVNGNDVYVGGYFTNAGGVEAHSIAKWNTLSHTWSGLGTGGGVFGGSCCSGGSYSSVKAIAVSGGDVYVGGFFNSAGGLDVNYIARFDGANWSPLGEGVTGDPNKNTHVAAIAVSGSNVYVGGSFTIAGSTAANNIAIWDGANWLSMGNGVPSTCHNVGIVSSIVVSGGTVHAGGCFSGGIAAWDGFSWNVMGGGVTSDVYSSPVVNAMAFSGSELYVGGSFNYAGGNPTNYLAKWNGGSWFALGTSSDNSIARSIRAIAPSGNDVYVGGCFYKAGTTLVNNIARWNSAANTWFALGSGVYSCVYAIATKGNEIYVGGSLSWAGGNPVNGIAKWDGANWTGVGGGVTLAGSSGYVEAIAISGNNLYVAGKFDQAGPIAAKNIARWDGNNWSALGSGIEGSLNAIAISGNNVYVAGNFTSAGGAVAKNVARWDGIAWSAMGNCGIDCQYQLSTVNAVATIGNDVFVGGSFSSARSPQKTSASPSSPRGVSASNIARWNLLTNTWSALGSGLDNTVTSLAASGNNLYVGGYFISAGDVDANHIAKWDGTNWSALGSGLNDSANAIAASGGTVYIAGNFTVAGTIASFHLARWSKMTSSIFFPLVKR